MTVYLVLCDDGEYEQNIDVTGVYSTLEQAQAVKVQWDERCSWALMTIEARELDAVPLPPEPQPRRPLPDTESHAPLSSGVYPQDIQPVKTVWVGGAQVLVMKA